MIRLVQRTRLRQIDLPKPLSSLGCTLQEIPSEAERTSQAHQNTITHLPLVTRCSRC
jgi:hypothetical protein